MPERCLFWKFGNKKVVRPGSLKLMIKESDTLLFDFENDLSEQDNMMHQYWEVAGKMKKEIIVAEEIMDHVIQKTR